MGDVRLVREAHQERRYLMNVVAPHLVERLPFLFPLYRDGPHRPWVVRTGVLLYSALARAKLNGRVSTNRALRLVPATPHRGTALLGALRGRVDERRAADDRERPRRRRIETRSSSTTRR